MITWRTSSYSSSGSNGGNCVEVGAWRKSSHSGNTSGNCLEAGHRSTGIAVRDTKDRAGATFTFTPDTWSGFIANLKTGAFEA